MAVDAVADPLPRLDLRGLVVDDGNPWTDAIRQELDTEGVPSTVVTPADPARPVITAAFLAEQLPDGTPHARFNAVVVPSSTTADLSAAEHAALIAFELQFGVREVDACEYPGPGTGQNPPTYAGPLDGVTATVTPAARAAGFGYLAGPVRFEDNDPAVPESFAYLSTPFP